MGKRVCEVFSNSEQNFRRLDSARTMIWGWEFNRWARSMELHTLLPLLVPPTGLPCISMLDAPY